MSPDEIRLTHQCQDLETSLGHNRTARVVFVGGALDRRWRVYRDLTFAFGATKDGAPDESTAVKTSALIATGATPVEALTAFHAAMHDPKAQAFYAERQMRGEDLELEPLLLSPTEIAERAKLRAYAKKSAEVAMEGARKHLHNQLAMSGLLGAAKRYHSKTGRLRMLFDKRFS